ncbi:hypothetical protein EDB89DRAFT_463766 [Lactarius sanguifluus]|nr:hypothetical protein EDB89DRAFT_463766 [Lactarius sanguifluus]
MYQQPLRQQQTWSGPQFVQAPKPPAVSAWPTAPVISSVHPASAAAPVPHPASQQSFVPPVPPGVNPQQWQNGRWMYTAPGGGMANAQPHGHPPPSLVGWNVPAGWGITPQYYHPPQTQKQPERSYWDTKLTDNGLGLENMHIKQPVAHTAPGASKDKAPHTPWAWVPRELDDDDDDAPQASSAAQYHNPPQPQQPGLVGHSGTGYPAQGHAYFSVPGDQQHHHPQQQQQQQQQQRQQQPQQPSANEAGSRPTLPPATVFSAHIRQRSNPNPHQPTTPTHTQPSTAPGSQSSTAPVPSQPAHGTQSLQRSHLVAPTPQRPGLPESFKSVKQLRPTFSPAIVRTPNHYRHDSQPMVPSPRVAPWEEGSAGLSASANRHLSGVAPMVPSPRVFPWNAHARASSPTPAPRNPQSSRVESSRMYDTSSIRGRQPVQRSYSIPEPPRPAPVLRQNSMPVVQSDPDAHHHPSRSSSTIPNLHQFAEEPGAVLSPLIGTVSESSESSASASTVVVSRSPPPLFIPPRYGPSPSPRPPRSRAAPSGSSSPSSSSDSSDSDDNHSPRRMYRSPSGSRSQRSTFSRHSGHSGNSGRSSGNYGGAYPGAVPPALQPPHTPQGRSPASSTHTHRSSASSNPLPTPPQERRDPGFSLPPPQQRKPPPGTYNRTVRYGFWNRRGDHLTNDQYVVYAPPKHANPRDLGDYPLPTEGYRDHYGNFIKYDATRRELPESLPREGRPPSLPYDRFVTYVYL